MKVEFFAFHTSHSIVLVEVSTEPTVDSMLYVRYFAYYGFIAPGDGRQLLSFRYELSGL